MAEEKEILGEILEEEKREFQEIANLDRQLHYELVRLVITEKTIQERKEVILSQLRNTLPQRESNLKEVITKRVGSETWEIHSDGKIYKKE